MYEIILNDLKKLFKEKSLLSPKDIAPIIATSPEVQANLRYQKRFPIPITKVGSKIGVTIYHLAEFLANGDVKVEDIGLEKKTAITPTKIASKPTGRSRDWLIAFQSQVNFQNDLIKCIEYELLNSDLLEKDNNYKEIKNKI